MLVKVAEQITRISNNEEINSENYLESLNYIDTVFRFVGKLKQVIPMANVIFEPTFKGIFTCQKYNIDSLPEENEMRYFVTNSPLFLEDYEEKKDRIREIFGPICETIEFDGATVRFILK